MNSITYSEARNNLATLISEVIGKKEPVIITQRNGNAAVLVSLDEYQRLQERAAHPFNADEWFGAELARTDVGEWGKR